jgi:hypothetical protein
MALPTQSAYASYAGGGDCKWIPSPLNPALCLLLSSAGLLSVTASASQMMRQSLLPFAALLGVGFWRKRLNGYHATGLAGCVVSQHAAPGEKKRASHGRGHQPQAPTCPHLSGIASLHSCIHAFTHSCIHSFIHSFTHSLIHSLTHSFIHSLIHSFIR